jgi:hypothetical protein
MNEGAGNKVYDLSGNGNTGTLTNGPIWVAGKYGHAVEFGGFESSDHIDLGNIDALNFGDGQDFTIITTFQTTSTRNGNYLISSGRGGAGDAWFGIYFSGNKLVGQVDDGADSVFKSSTDNYNTGARHVLAMVVNAKQTFKMYIDGLLIETSNSIAAVNSLANSESKYIGTRTIGADHDYEGPIDFVYAYNRALTASEIAQLYAEPFGMFKDPNELAILGGYTVSANNYEDLALEASFSMSSEMGSEVGPALAHIAAFMITRQCTS